MFKKSRPTIGFLTVEASSPYALQVWRSFVDTAKQLDVNLITYAGSVWPEPADHQFNRQGIALFYVTRLACPSSPPCIQFWIATAYVRKNAQLGELKYLVGNH